MRQKTVNRKLRKVNLTSLRDLIRKEKSKGNHMFARKIFISYQKNGGKSTYNNM